ncbi:MAG TPA: hypothetical protein VEI52_06000 [Terriglobales bacterium]|nr:hypothetical protein [Terriglobales bacterium]
MILFGALLAVLFASAIVIWRLKERSLYILFLAAYTQNLVVPLLFTHGYIGKDAARALLLIKDFLLLELFLWSVAILYKRFRPPWPSPLKPLLVFTVYCLLRFSVGVLLLGENMTEGLYKIKTMVFPLEILVVVIVLAALKPEFGARFLRDIIYILSALAVVAIAILIFAPRDFWVENANVAVLQADVKGSESEEALDFDKGISYSATMHGRELFAFMEAYRAVGTFGEALALSFSMAVPVLLLSFHFPKSFVSCLALTVVTAALFFSLTRSAWIFCAIVGSYVLIRRGWYRLFVFSAGLVVAFCLVFPPVAEFATTTIENLSPANDNADSEHAEGLLWFYTRGFTDAGNILGKGMNGEVQTIPENGYAYVLEHFGAVAYLSFLWFCFSIYQQLGKSGTRPCVLALFGQGIAIAMLIVMHFSYYPFSLPTFMSLWYVVGLCLSSYLLPKNSLAPKTIPVKRRARQLRFA